MARRSFKSVIPEIPLEVWRPLYAWADELRGLALWEEMGDAELLGVDHPQTSEPMLGVVMGEAKFLASPYTTNRKEYALRWKRLWAAAMSRTWKNFVRYRC